MLSTTVRRGITAVVTAGLALGLAPGLSAGAADAEARDTHTASTSWTSPADLHPGVHRWGGTDRYDTARIVAEHYGPAYTAYIASGQGFADALSASAAAAPGSDPDAPDGGKDAPVLLVRKHAIPRATDDALYAMNTMGVKLLGGPDAIAPMTAHGFIASEYFFEQIYGKDRYQTSAKAAQRFRPGVKTLYVASGADASFPDALAAGALAGSQDVPLLLTHPTKAKQSTLDAVKKLRPQRVVVVGGHRAVSPTVARALGADGRIAGRDRYETAAKVADRFGDHDTVMVASGTTYPDALTGGALAATWDIPVLLTRPDRLPEATRQQMQDQKLHRAVVLGGPKAVSVRVEDSVAGLLRR